MTFPGLAGRTAQTPQNAILQVFIITVCSRPPVAHLPGQISISSLQIRTTGGTCPSSPTTPLHLSLPLSTCTPGLQLRQPQQSLTFDVLQVAPRRPARVSSGQRGDTGEVVPHGIWPQGLRHSRGSGDAGQEPRYSVQVCARVGARRRGRALVGLRPGAGGRLLSSLSLGSAVFGGACPPRGSLREPSTCLPFPEASAGAKTGPLGGDPRRPGPPPSSGWRWGSGWWWAARWLRRALPGP